MKAYIDSSIILRIILGEENRIKLPDNLDEFAASEILKIECFRTFDRMQRVQKIADNEIAARYAGLHRAIRSLRIIKLTDTISKKACESFPVILKTLDAIHLASAILWQQQEETDILFLTHDEQLAKAALAMGFKVLGVPDTPFSP
jgi:predicted nucleic acid-binding protein